MRLLTYFSWRLFFYSISHGAESRSVQTIWPKRAPTNLGLSHSENYFLFLDSGRGKESVAMDLLTPHFLSNMAPYLSIQHWLAEQVS